MSTTTAPAVDQPTRVTTGKCRLSYAHLFEPSSIEEGGDKKYSVSLIIPKSDTATLDKVRAAIKAAAELGKVKLGGKIPTNLKTPLRDGDVDRSEDPAYADSYFINCSSKSKPVILDRYKAVIEDKDVVYSGCYGRASINFFAFNTSGNKGIAAGLNGLQKLEDGEPLGGRGNVANDFDDLDEADDFMA